jgi:hypothetical protein
MVIAGYSFPPTDTRAFQLVAKDLRSRGNKEIEIVAPDTLTIMERVKGQLGKSEKLVPRPMTIETHIFDALAVRAPEMMIGSAAAFQSVRSWLERVFAFQLASFEKRRAPRQSAGEWSPRFATECAQTGTTGGPSRISQSCIIINLPARVRPKSPRSWTHNPSVAGRGYHPCHSQPQKFAARGQS